MKSINRNWPASAMCVVAITATVEFTQRFQRNHEHWVAAMVGPNRPRGICVGVVEARPLRTGSDTLFVMYGSLPHGVIC